MATGLQVLARVRLGPRGQGLADLHGRWEDGDTTVRVNNGRPRGSLSTLSLGLQFTPVPFPDLVLIGTSLWIMTRVSKSLNPN